MIHTIRTITVGQDECVIDRPIMLYRGDRDLEVEFSLVGNSFMFGTDGNVLASMQAKYAQLVVNTPSGLNMFSDIVACRKGNVIFTIRGEMIDEIKEVGMYAFQIRLLDATQTSRVTLPPVYNGIEIRQPIAAEDQENITGDGVVDYAELNRYTSETGPTFNSLGDYNKTTWQQRDIISTYRMNKIEDALYQINKHCQDTIDIHENQISQLEANYNAGFENVNKNINERIEYMQGEVNEAETAMNTAKEEMESAKNEVIAVVDQAELDLTAQVNEDFTAAKDELKAYVDNIKSFQSVYDFGAVGDGTADDTNAIQKAFDEAKGTIFFPKGTYKITRGLTLTRNVDIIGVSTRNTVIRADILGDSEDLLTIAITENWGFGDVRNWRINNLSLLRNKCGRYCLSVLGGSQILQMLTSEIRNCNMDKLYVKDNLAHCSIMENTLGSAYFEFFDANLVEKNLFSGNECGITINIISGVRNNTIRNNTIVCRDGAVRVINGDNIRIENNQCEQPSMCQNEYKSMIILEGRDRQCINTIIKTNNFGGGTNLDRSIYVNNAHKTVIEDNNFISVPVADIELTENAKYTFLSPNNLVLSTPSCFRYNNPFNMIVNDRGEGTFGNPRDFSISENVSGNSKIIKSDSNLVSHQGYLSVVTPIEQNSVHVTLPKSYRPEINKRIALLTDRGIGYAKHIYNGKLSFENIPSDATEFNIIPFSASNDQYSNIDFDIFSNFEDLNHFNTGEQWNIIGIDNLTTNNGVVSLVREEMGITSYAILDCGVTPKEIQVTLPSIYSGWANTTRIIFRYIDNQNYMYIAPNDINGAAYGIHKIENGVDTQIRAMYSTSYKNGDVVKIILNGLNISIELNGERVTSIDNAFLSDSTQVGFRLMHTNRNGISLFGVNI